MALVYEEESYAILGACFEVYKQKGCGFHEPVYHECLTIEFELRNIPFQSELKLELEYKGRKLKQFYAPDFICYDKIIMEIKAVSVLNAVFRAQLQNYLRAAVIVSAFWSISRIIQNWSTNGLSAECLAGPFPCLPCIPWLPTSA